MWLCVSACVCAWLCVAVCGCVWLGVSVRIFVCMCVCVTHRPAVAFAATACRNCWAPSAKCFHLRIRAPKQPFASASTRCCPPIFPIWWACTWQSLRCQWQCPVSGIMMMHSVHAGPCLVRCVQSPMISVCLSSLSFDVISSEGVMIRTSAQHLTQRVWNVTTEFDNSVVTFHTRCCAKEYWCLSTWSLNIAAPRCLHNPHTYILVLRNDSLNLSAQRLWNSTTCNNCCNTLECDYLS